MEVDSSVEHILHRIGAPFHRFLTNSDPIRTNEIDVRLREAEIANTGLDADDKRRYVVTISLNLPFHSRFIFLLQGEIEGFYMDSMFTLIPGIPGLTPNGSDILTDFDLRFKSLTDGSSKSAIMGQGSVVYNLLEEAKVVLWGEKVQRSSIQEDGTINIETYFFFKSILIHRR